MMRPIIKTCLAESIALCHAVAPVDIADTTLDVLLASDLGWTEAMGAFGLTGPAANAAIGRTTGCAIILNDRGIADLNPDPEKLRLQLIDVVLHELAHGLASNFWPQDGDAKLSDREIRLSKRACELEIGVDLYSEMGADEMRRMYEHHDPHFLRACAHVAARATREGYEVGTFGVVAYRQLFGLALRADEVLAAEVNDLAGFTFKQIRGFPAPDEFKNVEMQWTENLRRARGAMNTEKNR